MFLKLKAFTEKYEMFASDDHVVLGLSGGADSVCLFFFLLELSKSMNLTITAVHVNHGLRGEAAEADEMFVRELCRKYDVELLVFREKVEELAEDLKMSTEEAGRYLRRRCFLNVMEEKKADKIALAHHQNDDAETILMNLCRGSGIKGMTGISPKEGAFVRPLLAVSRAEIEKYLAEREISFCTDETNFEDKYTRNRIRHHVIPYLESDINKESVAHIQAMAKKLMEVENYLETETIEYTEKILKRNARELESGEKGEGRESQMIYEEDWQQIPPALRSYVMKRLLEDFSGAVKDLGEAHVEALILLFEKQVGRRLSLPYQVTAWRVYRGVKLIKNEEKSAEESAVYSLEEAAHFRMKRFPYLNNARFPESDYTKWFDCDTISGSLSVRHREAGDFIVLNRDGSRQKLKKFFINEKIPSDQRDKIWLLAQGHEILWIVGYRQSKKYQISAGTEEVMEITYVPENKE